MSDLDIGQKIGPFVLVEELHEGVMTSVWRAHSPSFGAVALKILRPQGGSPWRRPRDRFSGEIDILTKVDHPNVVGLVSSDINGDPPWIAMRYVDGWDLSDPTAEGRSQEFVLRLASGLGKGLAHLHDLGIVHRDVKPQNIRILHDGTAVLVDMGIAITRSSERHTELGAVAATLAYASPEQLTGADLTPASDIFSLGSALFFATTGRSPFPGADARQVLIAQQRRDIDTSILPERLGTLIVDCLDPDPAGRPRASEVAQRTASLLHGLRDEPADPACVAPQADETPTLVLPEPTDIPPTKVEPAGVREQVIAVPRTRPLPTPVPVCAPRGSGRRPVSLPRRDDADEVQPSPKGRASRGLRAGGRRATRGVRRVLAGVVAVGLVMTGLAFATQERWEPRWVAFETGRRGRSIHPDGDCAEGACTVGKGPVFAIRVRWGSSGRGDAALVDPEVNIAPRGATTASNALARCVPAPGRAWSSRTGWREYSATRRNSKGFARCYERVFQGGAQESEGPSIPLGILQVYDARSRTLVEVSIGTSSTARSVPRPRGAFTGPLGSPVTPDEWYLAWGHALAVLDNAKNFDGASAVGKVFFRSSEWHGPAGYDWPGSFIGLLMIMIPGCQAGLVADSGIGV